MRRFNQAWLIAWRSSALRNPSIAPLWLRRATGEVLKECALARRGVVPPSGARCVVRARVHNTAPTALAQSLLVLDLRRARGCSRRPRTTAKPAPSGEACTVSAWSTSSPSRNGRGVHEARSTSLGEMGIPRIVWTTGVLVASGHPGMLRLLPGGEVRERERGGRL